MLSASDPDQCQVSAGEFSMRRSVLLLITAVAFAALSAWAPAQASRPGLQITHRIDDRVRVTLAGNTRPEARNPKYDRGAVPDSLRLDHLQLLLNRSPNSERMLVHVIDQLTNPKSRNFHHWLTPPEFGHEFGPARGDIQRITSWLKSKGFTINAIHVSGMVIDFSGTAGLVNHVFLAPIHYLNVKGARHIANMRDPQIPAALSRAVNGIVSLNDFQPHAMNRLRPKSAFKVQAGASGAVVPGDLAQIYNFNPAFSAGISGTGQTIAVVEDSNMYSTDDWTRFRSTFGLSAYKSGKLITVHPNTSSSRGDCRNPGTNADDAEASIDAEYASAGAPSATIEIASCANLISTSGVIIALENLVNSNTAPPIISVSYGECEAHLGATANAAYYAIYQQAAAEGISVFVAAGNESAASCDAGNWVSFQGVSVSGLASTPYNVAVGGTDFADSYLKEGGKYWGVANGKTYESALSYIPEIPWNDSCASVLGATFLTGSPITYGPNGFCNTNEGSKFWDLAGGSGGPSGCAYGASDMNSAGAVSGTCSGYAKPAWQSADGNPAGGTRDVPDVSLFAGDGAWSRYYVFCWDDPRFGGANCGNAPAAWSRGGGTSFAASTMAAVQALIDEKAGSRQGNPAPAYYALASKEYAGNTSCNSSLGNAVSPSCVFHDVTLGDMDTSCSSAQDLGFNAPDYSGPVGCYMDGEFMGVLSTANASDQMAYGAATGWDFATGLGTVNVANLVNAWP
jgi:subtilase family serine protease